MQSRKRSSKMSQSKPSVPRALPYRPELSNFDVNYSGTCATTFTNALISSIAQGAAYNNRDGSVVTPSSLEITGQITSLSSIENATVRVILAKCRYDQATQTATDAVNPSGGSSFNIVGAYNRDFVGQADSDTRLVILKDEIFTMNTGSRLNVVFYWKIKTEGLIRWLSSNASNIPVDGGYSIFFVCNTSSVVTFPSINFYSRLVFADS